MGVDDKVKLALGDLALSNMIKEAQLEAQGAELRATKDALAVAHAKIAELTPASSASAESAGDGV